MAWTKEQELAIHKSGTNIIVSAGAGSGKTAVLSTRVLEKLKNGIHINELLILTFTNAAAKEMETRIRKKIKENNLLEELALLDSAYITTFDSFALSIVKKYHYLLNIPKEIGITDESILSLQKKKILTEVFEDLYEKEEEDFLNFINDFCSKDDKEIKQELLNLANSLELKTEKENYLKNYVTSFYQKEKIEELIKLYEKIIREKINELKTEIDLQKNNLENEYVESLHNWLEPIKTEPNLNKLIAKIETAKLPSLKRGSPEESKDAKENIKEVLDHLKEMTSFNTVEELKSDYEETKSYLKTITNILLQYFEKLSHWKKEKNAFDFTDIAKMSIKILKENEQIKDELKFSLKEIMIDEYQDTSDTQEELISLIENQNVYMVGDIKQSIYRFRNANPYIFKNKYDNYANQNQGIKIDLLKNFRSRKEVLEDINTIFNPIMSNTIGNADYIKSHQMNFGNTSYIEEGNTKENYHMEILEYLKPENYTKEEIEIFAIAKDILNKVTKKYPVYDKDERKIHEARWNDFCIIMDRNSSFDLTKKIFEFFKIPLAMYKDEVLNDSYDLFLLKNLIEILICLKERNLKQEFKYAFTSIARSYLYNLKDEEIFDTLEKKNYFDSKIIKDISPLVCLVNVTSIKEIIEKLLQKTNFYEKIITHGEITNSTIRMEKMLELGENLKNLNYDIYDFLEYLKELVTEKQIIKISTEEENDNAVKIMNIHKSKGLEFNICYFCGLYKSFSKEDLKGNIIYEKSLPIYVANKKEGTKETFLKLLIQDKIKKEDISEKIRLFYVALTRAKEKMIFLLPEKENLEELKDKEGIVLESIRYKYKSLGDILYSIPKTIKKYTTKIKIEELHLNKDYQEIKSLNKQIDKKEKNILVEELHIEETKGKGKEHFSKKINKCIGKKEKKNMELGTKFHNILELIDLENIENINIEDQFIKKRIQNLMQSDLLKTINQARIFQEYEFIYEKEKKEYHGIIDLMLVYETHIDIIDYKLNDITDDAYINQLKGYKEYIETISNKPVHTYLFSILEQKIKEID